ncbi:MAG: GNAT family N-acetyltransferase [Negativicutes bacterium]|nr:GNAT family N-acetyltransferase [Negativicutes bacterium]
MTGISPQLRCSVPVGIMEWATGPAAEAILADLAAPDINRARLEKITASGARQFRAGAGAISLQAYPLSGTYRQHIQEFQTAYKNIGNYLKDPGQAFEYETSGQARTTLFFDGAANRLAAYASLKCSSLRVQVDSLNAVVLPAVELVMLCVDDRYRRRGVGEAALSYLIRGLYEVKKRVGVRLVTLFAVKDAVDFYRRKFGFSELSQGLQMFLAPDYGSCVPMYLALPREQVL